MLNLDYLHQNKNPLDMNRNSFTTAFKQFQSPNIPYQKYFLNKKDLNQTRISLKQKKQQQKTTY